MSSHQFGCAGHTVQKQRPKQFFCIKGRTLCTDCKTNTDTWVGNKGIMIICALTQCCAAPTNTQTRVPCDTYVRSVLNWAPQTSPGQTAVAELASHYVPKITTTPSPVQLDTSPQARHSFWSKTQTFSGTKNHERENQDSMMELLWIDPIFQGEKTRCHQRREITLSKAK